VLSSAIALTSLISSILRERKRKEDRTFEAALKILMINFEDLNCLHLQTITDRMNYFNNLCCAVKAISDGKFENFKDEFEKRIKDSEGQLLG